MILLFDITNLVICLLFIVIVQKLKIIPSWIAFLFSIYSFIPFFLNDFLFPTNYIKDQLAYTFMLQEVRSFNFFHGDKIFIENSKTLIDDSYLISNKQLVTSWFLALIPLPFVETIKSLGFFNRFLFMILFIWLYKKKFLTGMTLFFIIFYPSLILYTSLSLRDPLIMFFMIMAAIFLIDKKYLNFLITISPLYFIKYQNFYLLVILFFTFIIFKKHKKLNNILLFFISSIIIFCILIFSDILIMLDKIRFSMFIENGGDAEDYESLIMSSKFFINIFFATINILIRPLPWEALNILQLLQSFENIFVLFFLVLFTIKSYKQDSFITNKWLFFTLFSLALYGTITFNLGTLSRFKFVFLVLYVVGLAYELYRNNGYKFNFIIKKNIN